MDVFENPNNLPLAEVKWKVTTDGIVEEVDALNKRWVSDRYFLYYEAPAIYNDDGTEIPGAKEYWMSAINYIINDLRWLLNLPFYKFWSNIIYNPSILNTLVSFLQEAPPFYAIENFPNYPEMWELFKSLHRYVLVVFTRLVTRQESQKEYMSILYFGNLLYENYIFTVPIIFDICQLYGRENEKIVARILQFVFKVEPRYIEDMNKAVTCLIKAFENVEKRFDQSAVNSNKAIPLDGKVSPAKITLYRLEDMILYLLDISSTINVFLKTYPPAVSIFHREDFLNKIVLVYGRTIPEMFQTLDKLTCNDNMPKYMELRHRLDVTRIELLNLFRTIIQDPISNIEKNLNEIPKSEIQERVDDYINLLYGVISESEFIIDYDIIYPVQSDLDALSKICPEFDTIKSDYILQVISMAVGQSNAPSVTVPNNVNEPVAGPSGFTAGNNSTSYEKKSSIKKSEIELVTLISEVKDIWNDLDDDFVKICLDHYDYNSESVINAILEESLPPNLKALKDSGPSENHSPLTHTDTLINENLAFKMEYINTNDDDDNVRVKSPEIEVPKDYIKRNYSLVVDEYEDEYDDTYDDRNLDNVQDDAVEMDSRPFTTPRVLLGKEKVQATESPESEVEEEPTIENGEDHFTENPKVVRARAEQRRQSKRGGRRRRAR